MSDVNPNYMKAFGIFSGLDNDAYKALADAATLEEYSIGEFIIKEGEEPAELFFIIEGNVEVMLPGVGFVELGGGNIFGEASLMEAGEFLPSGWRVKRRNATCVARTELKLAKIDVDQLSDLLKRHPQVQSRFAKLAEARSRG